MTASLGASEPVRTYKPGEPGTTAEPRLLRMAQDERDHVERLLNAHIGKCRHHGCPDCLSLARHRDRCERQVGLLEGEETDAATLF